MDETVNYRQDFGRHINVKVETSLRWFPKIFCTDFSLDRFFPDEGYKAIRNISIDL